MKKPEDDTNNDTIRITRMEREMFEAAGFDVNALLLEDDIRVIKAVAEVATKWIERAFNAGCHYIISLDSTNEEDCQKWLKENGIRIDANDIKHEQKDEPESSVRAISSENGITTGDE